ncbi:Non-specific serine/threonine protein kinase [Bertholletia excelsa]
MGVPRWFCFFCLVCLLCVHSIACKSSSPVDTFLINCGGNRAVEVDDGRVFEPDSGNPNLVFSSNSHTVVSTTEVGVSSLYSSARVFTKSSAYEISTTQIGHHFLRLHFYPVGNSQYNLQSAVFSVAANGITLLHGFSFSKSSNIYPFFKEYVIEVGGSTSSKLVLSLSPWNNSIAFINGIEILSIPSRQFSSNANPIPIGPDVQIPSQVGLETLYRLNMGGPLLTPKNDTLWRIWKSDKPFLVNPASARNVFANPRSIKYPNGESVEIAPNWVYATAQAMADANVTNQKFNISWAFEVDEGFTYLIRMHFCDIVSSALYNLVFNVYINNQTALDSFDISSKTMALSAAYFVDFVVNVSMGSRRILVQVGPPNLRNFPMDAILNGLEIMKISGPGDSLDGNLRASSLDSKASKSDKHVFLVIFSCLGGFAVLVLILAAIFFYFRRPKKPKRQISTWLPVYNLAGVSDTKVSMGSFAPSMASLGLGRILAFSEIREATKNFDESLVLGVGGFGKVYKGILETGTVVAVKRGNPKSQQGLIEFKTEIEMLSKLRHRHLVSLIGYCEELNEMILVYEFMAGGPLRKHLYGSNLPPLTWKHRLEICIGAAKGLHYLHTGASESIIHRDVKTTNILLDENFTAKMADFGLSKFGPTLDQTHVSTAVKGSFGYLDPEYYRRQQLTEKSDVYSFGVVLMEVLCARPAINPSLPREQVNIAEWAMFWQKKGHLEHIIDPRLAGSLSLDSLRKFGETAEKCLAEYGSNRPTMGDVLWNLEYALQLHEAYLQSLGDEDSASQTPSIPDYCIPGDCSDIVSDQDSDATTRVFSQLINPKGR